MTGENFVSFAIDFFHHHGSMKNVILMLLFPASARFLLTNGSLLLVKTKPSDAGDYHCTASNQFVEKPAKSIPAAKVTIMTRSSNDAIQPDPNKLLPSLQNSELQILSGKTLLLHCASHANKVSSYRDESFFTSSSS